MKKKRISCLKLLPLILFTGCQTTGLSNHDPGGNAYSRLVYAHMAKERAVPAADKINAITPPVRIAVAQAGELAPPPELTEGLKAHSDLVRHVISLPLPAEETNRYGHARNSVNTDEHFSDRIDTLLRLARNQRADQLMIIGGRVESRTVGSPLELLNILIVPYFIIPTQNVEVETHAAAMVLDVQTGGVLSTLSTTARGKTIRPGAYARDAHVTLAKKQKPELLEGLITEYTEFMRNR